jgi:hypothetical protein
MLQLILAAMSLNNGGNVTLNHCPVVGEPPPVSGQPFKREIAYRMLS